jgi:hypothetical protein
VTERHPAVEAAAQLMATNPGAGERALAVHARREDGRCGGCTTRLTWWPCAIASIARRAVALRPAAHPRADRA